MAGPRGEVSHVKSRNDLPRLALAASEARHLEFFCGLEVCFCSAGCVAAKNVEVVAEQTACVALPGFQHVGERCNSSAHNAILEAMLVDRVYASISAASHNHGKFCQLAKTREFEGLTRHVLQSLCNRDVSINLDQSTG